MAHDMHLTKASDSVSFSRPDVRTSPSWKSAGTHVTERRPSDVYSVFMLYDRGRHLDIECATSACDVPTVTDTDEHVLARVGPRFLLPFAGARAPFSGLVNWRQNGRYASGELERQADLLYFTAEVDPPHGW